MSKKPLVFLAHNSQDKPQVKIVADALKQKGIDTWLDEEQIPPGVLFQEHLQKAIAEIDYALIFIGKSGVGQWQAIEIQSFFSKLVMSRIPVIPVLLPGVKKLPDDMVFLAEINYVQFSDDIRDENTINKIVWGITANKKPLVFLAHNSQDKPQVRIVADALKQKGIDTWLDEDQIPPGVMFQEHLQKAINEIDYALIFIGKNGVDAWQAIEIQSFFSKLVMSRIPVIPVLLPGVKNLPKDMMFLCEINYVQFLDDIKDQNTINKIVWGITGKSSYINYDGLESFLRSGLWREANSETRRIILQAANREKDGWLNEQETRDFDDDILLKLDNLWRQYSKDRFGFSVQKKLLKDCEQDTVAFGTKVGWKHLGGWVDGAHIDYSLAAPIGHLPYGMLQLVELNNAIVEGIVNAQWVVTKVLVTQDWQRQLLSDVVGLFELVSGNKNFDSGEFKKGLDFQLKHDEAWWQGERAEVMKIKNLCLLLFSCSSLDTVEDSESSSSSVTDQIGQEDKSDRQSAGFSQVNTGNGTGWQVNVSGGTVNINPPNR
jgi:uncharacterized protein YbcV (DUF1398 family)